MDARRPCQRCGVVLREEEAVTLWCGRHAFLRRPDGSGFSAAETESYVVVLCARCAPSAWAPLRDLLRRLVPAAEERPPGPPGAGGAAVGG
jgi:hypothetical protein